MPGMTRAKETKEGNEDKTKSRVLSDAGRVGVVTYCIRAWKVSSSRNCKMGELMKNMLRYLLHGQPLYDWTII